MAYLPDVPEEERVNNTRGLSHGNPAPEMVEAIDAVHWWIFPRDES